MPGDNALIPDTNDTVVDVDIQEGRKGASTLWTGPSRMAAYVGAFENQNFKPASGLDARAGGERIRSTLGIILILAMPWGFVLRPEGELGGDSASNTAPKRWPAKPRTILAAVCAGMFSRSGTCMFPSRIAGTEMPVFDRPRTAQCQSARPQGHLGQPRQRGPSAMGRRARPISVYRHLRVG